MGVVASTVVRDIPVHLKIIVSVLQTTDTCPLHHLNLRANPLGPEGLMKLFSFMIRNMERPTELNLAAIGFTEEEAILLGDVILPFNKALQYLDISNNVCGIEGGKAIARGVDAHNQLLYVEHRGCGFNADSKFSIKKSLYRNYCFQQKRPYNEQDVFEEDECEIRSNNVESLIDEDIEEQEEVEEEQEPNDDD